MPFLGFAAATLITVEIFNVAMAWLSDAMDA